MTAQQLPGAHHEPAPAHDPQLSLAGVSRDGTKLLLESRSGARFVLPVDARLSAALRGDTSTIGQLELTMESTLRPRDIQARIRSGETPDSVAKAASTTVDKIMPYAAPVLAERVHITERARRSSLRRPGAGARTLGEAVETHLRSLDLDPTALTWDAWRRGDGRWTVVADVSAAGRPDTATFTFDAPGNFVLLEDEQAHWLVGAESLADAPVDPPPAPVQALTAVPGPERVDPVVDDGAHYEQPLEAFLDQRPGLDESDLQAEAEDAAALDHTPADDLADEAVDAEPASEQPLDQPVDDEEPPVRRPVRKKGGRASVPSWDEIMFGGSDKG